MTANNFTWRPGRAAAPLVLGCTVLLAACGGEDGGVNIGDGQDPDPVVLDFPIAYVKRPVPLDAMGNPVQRDLREQIAFDLGAELFVRDRASPTSQQRSVSFREIADQGDVRDVEFSYDNAKVVFAMRGPFIVGADEEDQPTWNIWEYELATDTLRRVIASDIVAEEAHDIDPHYLPDGRIVFSSTRQRQSRAILLDEGKPQFAALDEDRNEWAFVLHVMNADGSDIHQISFNQSHDLDPNVLGNGQVVFSRWDHMGGRNALHLYRVNPDGTGLELHYGAMSHATGTSNSIVQFVIPRETPDGPIMALARPFTATDEGGQILVIDTPVYVENTQPTLPNQGMPGPAQQPATINNVETGGGPSPGGRFGSLYPLWDDTDRMLVSWTQCRLIDPLTSAIVACTPQRLADPAFLPAPPLYGLWIYDRDADTQLPIVAPEEGFLYSEVVAAQPRPLPPVILDKVPGIDVDADLAAEGLGLIHIRSVYDIDGVDVANPSIAVLADPAQTTAAERPARFLRVLKAVSIPDEDVLDFDVSAFGVSAGQGMREILGYAPIEPDGSVRIKVPANVPLAISVLDADGRRIGPRHQAWLQLRPGEVLECGGCHNPASGLSHGRYDSFASVNAGAPTTGLPFPNTDPALFADFGETMAETRTRHSCVTDCAALAPSVDLIYDDVWTDEAAAGRSRDASFAYRYAGLVTPAPTSAQCQTSWSSVCRITINYVAHLHPLWEVLRIVLDVDGVTVLEDHTCTSCHNTRDAMGNVQLPAGQLDLTGGPSTDEPDHVTSYRELLVTDNEQELVDGALQDRLVQIGVDPITGDPIFAPVPVAPSMSVGGAGASNRFFSRFDAGGSHQGYLTAAELRLIAEWLDIGGQYYNNPFDAPVN